MDNLNNGVWKRPENVPYPSVWKKFKGKKEINGVIPNFWIQDVPEQEFEKFTKIMITDFADDEPVCKYSNLTSDKTSLDEMYQVWLNMYKQKLAIVCYTDNPDPNGKPIIAGLNCTGVTSKNLNPDHNFTGVAVTKIMGTCDYVGHLKDYFEFLQVDHLLCALGLYVFPAFRGQGIGYQLLDAREPLCRAVGLTGTITPFSAVASQLIAFKVGFKVISEETYEKIKEVNPKLDFPGIERESKDFKYMYKMYS